MELRQKLLVSFIAVIIASSFVFGFNAYQVAKHTVLDKELSVVSEATGTQAALLAAEYRRTQSLDDLRDHLLIAADPKNLSALLLDRNEKIVASAASRDESVIPAVDFPLLRILQGDHHLHEFTVGGRRYIWARAAIPGAPYSLVRIERSYSDEQGMLKRLVRRLFVAGLILGWVAIWVALLISTAVSRRLTVQTKALEYQASHDSLTGLPNRSLLQKHLEAAICAAESTGRSVALVMMDLDRFKEINSTLGHNFGDALLQALGDRLQKALWGSDTVARLGGDEYALLLPMTDFTHSAQVTDKILTTIAAPFVINGVTLEIDASLGIAIYPEDGKDSVELISHADVAMYQAKHAGVQVTRYDYARDPYSLERLKLVGELRHAQDRGELFLHYQPKIDIANRVVTGAEALLRWHHPEFGLIQPDTFIPMAEQTGIIKGLTYWVLDNAIRQCARWNRAGITLCIAVNLSARVVQDANLVAAVAAALERHGVGAEQVTLEMTETAIMHDPTRAMEMLNSLSSMGVHLSIDDFGTGYTSMAYLKKLPVDEVKIDKSFVMNMLKDANDGVIVRSIVDLAHNMNYTVVAEGVESKRVLELLCGMTCDLAQGYYFSRPLSVPDFESWLETFRVDVPHSARVENPENEIRTAYRRPS
ncbi:MAG: putative bifunctional diguanylate cyclase/phosphodiesterase [Acidiferrobacterales bacterium]